MSEQFGEDLILIERLAFGGMAEVFLAKNVGHGGFEKTVAVKRILPQYNSRPEFQAMFEREMKICAHLQHPNIVQIYRNGVWQDYLYLVMEFVNGKTVLKLLETAEAKGEFVPPAVACYIIRETARGLQYAHNCADPISGEHLSIVHRDISPHNLMVTYTGEVKILDFGIARAADTADLTRTGELKGKIPYMAPEIIEGGPPTRRSDVFSLGVVLYELLAIRRLFAGGSTFQTMRKIREHEIPPLRQINPNVTEQLEHIVYRMLARDEVQRYQNCGEIERDLSALIQNSYPHFDHSEVATYITDLFKAEIVDERRSRSVRMSSTVIQEAPGHSGPDGTKGNEPRRTEAYESNQFDSGTVIDSGTHRETVKRWSLSVILLASIVVTIVIGLTMRHREVIADSIKPIDPSGVRGLIAWFNADAVSLPDQSRVELWVSTTSAVAQAIQGNSGAQPILQKNKLNGHAVVTFDGNTQFLTADELAQSLTTCGERTIIYVAAARKDKVQYVLSAHQADKLADVFRAGYAQGNRLRIKTTNDPGKYEDSSPAIIDKFAIYSVTFGRSRGQLYQNGQLAITSSAQGVDPAGTAYFSIGQEWDGPVPSDFFAGDIAQILVFCSNISDAERQGIEAWLSAYYGIQLQP